MVRTMTWDPPKKLNAEPPAGVAWSGYLLIPHDAVAENMTLAGLAAAYTITRPRATLS